MKVTISNPCSENYHLMHLSDKGRFCDFCRKEVIDFTKLTDFEIARFLANNIGKVCGRFTNSQLEKDYIYNRPLFNRHWITGVFSSLFVISSLAAYAKIERLEKAKFESVRFKSDHCAKKVQNTLDSLLNIKGKVVDNQGLPLPGVNVKIKGTDLKTASNIDGEFDLILPTGFKFDGAQLEFLYVGFEPQVMPINGYKKGKDLLIKLLESNTALGGLEYIKLPDPTLLQRVKRLFN